MSDSLSPWIAAYLVGVAEEYGADMIAIPRSSKKKKVQLIEFLTYGEDDVIWGRISDKDFSIPVRFSKLAVQEYNKFNEVRLTSYKTAIIAIKDFKPFFARIPLGKNKMSSDAYLAIECDALSTIGSYGETPFGRPNNIQKHSDLREWSEGLRKDGGAGNCLKIRKQAREESAESTNPTKPAPPLQQVLTVPQEQPKKKQQTKESKPLSKRPIRDATWAIAKDGLFRKPPTKVALLHATMKVDGDPESETNDLEHPKVEVKDYASPQKKRRLSTAPKTPPGGSKTRVRSRSATPISEKEWPPSHVDLRPSSRKPLSHSPSPAPRSQLVSPMVSSSPPKSVRQSSVVPESSPPHNETFLPEPSLPSLSQAVLVEETRLLPHALSLMPKNRQVLRKVPRPHPPVPPADSQRETIILVPNSDVSLSHSQLPSQRQSQSRSQLSQNPSSSQPVVLSQLAALSRSHKPQDQESEAPPGDASRATEEDVQKIDHEPNSEIHSQDYDGDRSSPNISPSKHKLISPERQLRPVSTSNDHPTSSPGQKRSAGTLNNSRRSARVSALRSFPSSEFVQDEALSKELGDASLVVHPPQSQSVGPGSHEVVIESPPHEKEHPSENNSTTRVDHESEKQESPTFDASQVLDEDDAQTHANLYAGLFTQESQTQQPSPPLSDNGDEPLRKSPGSTNLTPDEAKCERVAYSECASRQDTLENVYSKSIDVDMREVQHDAIAWKEPTFLSSRKKGKGKSSISASTSSAVQATKRKTVDFVVVSSSSSSSSSSRPGPAPQVPKSSRVLNEPSKPPLQQALIQPAAPERDKPTPSSSRGNRDTTASSPSAPSARRQVHKRNEDSFRDQGLAIGTEMKSGSSRAQQSKKRTKRTSSIADDSRVEDSAEEPAKKKQKMSEPRKRRDAQRKSSVGTGDATDGKLNGFTVNLDRINIDEPRVKERAVTWERLLEVLRSVLIDRGVDRI